MPLVHIELPPVIERRTVRGEPRALATLRTLVKVNDDAEGVLVDLSVGGARIAVTENVVLIKGQYVELHTRPRLLQREYGLILKCQVTGTAGANDPNPPHVRSMALTSKPLRHGSFSASLLCAAMSRSRVRCASQVLLDRRRKSKR